MGNAETRFGPFQVVVAFFVEIGGGERKKIVGKLKKKVSLVLSRRFFGDLNESVFFFSIKKRVIFYISKREDSEVR